MPEDQIDDRSAPLPGGMPSGRGAGADPDVAASLTRRRFSEAEKARIVREADEFTERGSLGALLRREGVYSSHLSAWRQQLRELGVDGLAARKRSPAPKAKPNARELELERKTRKLEKELAKAKAVIEFQKSARALGDRPEEPRARRGRLVKAVG